LGDTTKLLTDEPMRSCPRSPKDSRIRTTLVLGLLVSALPGFAQAARTAECKASSGKATLPLVELFTSEGCSSCPPADRWLSKVGRPANNRPPVAALAFHVDYWNQLGWEDPYATVDFTHRQYRYASLRGTRTVYTPQVLLNGTDFRRWHTASADSEIAAAARTPAAADITLTLATLGRDIDVAATVSLAQKQSDAVLFLALTENGLRNPIEAGENAGLTLHHDHVVRRLAGPYTIDDSPSKVVTAKFHIDREWIAQNMGVVAFVQRQSDGQVLQALTRSVCG